ncbi:hypothetical protein CsSME_00045673 [Camellia sinensis var. sinensis]
MYGSYSFINVSYGQEGFDNRQLEKHSGGSCGRRYCCKTL